MFYRLAISVRISLRLTAALPICARQVIFSVYHEKEKTWEKELRKIKAIYDNRLKASQQRALKMEQMLTMQTYQVSRRSRAVTTHQSL